MFDKSDYMKLFLCGLIFAGYIAYTGCLLVGYGVGVRSSSVPQETSSSAPQETDSTTLPESVISEYKGYLDGQPVDLHNIDPSQYEVTVDHEARKVFMTRK